ncbi:DUF551 domain-containing protein [Cronobacter dublinensis]
MSEISNEKIQWLHDAATEFASTGMKMTMNPDEVLQLTTPLLALRKEREAAVPDFGQIRVGRLPTINQDDYPGLGSWWVQLRIGEDSEEILARVYGDTPQEAYSRAEALAYRSATLTVPAAACAEITVLERQRDELLAALEDIIAYNVQYATDKYGDASKAEAMACVRRCREAIARAKGGAAPPALEHVDQIAEQDRIASATAGAYMQGCRDTEARLAKALPALPAPVDAGWIACSERMPEEGAEVYIFCDGEWVLEAQYREGDFYDVVRDGIEVFETVSRCVSHWQPRPQRPAAPGKEG